MFCFVTVAENGIVSDWQQFNKVAQTLQPGDTLVIQDGVYTNWQVHSSFALTKKDMVISVSGTPEKHITIKPQSPGGVVLRFAYLVHCKKC